MVHDSAIYTSCPQLVRIKRRLESYRQLCARFRFEDVPHLGLAAGTRFESCSLFVAGMDLHGKILSGEQELDQERRARFRKPELAHLLFRIGKPGLELSRAPDL